MRSKWIPLVCAGPFVACSALAGQQKHLIPQTLPGREVFPTRAASYTVLDGHMVLTSNWVQLDRPSTRDIFTCAFDSIEIDLTGGIMGAPTDQPNPPGPTGCPDALIADGSRWFLGETYTNPFVSADINDVVPGALCEGVAHAWYVDVGDGEADTDLDGLPDSPLFIAIQMFETMDVSTCTDDGSDFIDGVIYDFSGNAWDPAFFNYTTITLNGSGLFHTMPADGAGGYQVIYGIAFDPTTGIITIPNPIDPVTLTGVNVQCMLWGTGANEAAAPDDGRCGVDLDGQFDDDAPLDGVHDLALECYSYLYGVCPDPLACATGFFYKNNNPCNCPGDINCDGIVDIADLALILGAFGYCDGDPLYILAADFDLDGCITLSDLVQFLSVFGSTC
jgi:hypothetical protein